MKKIIVVTILMIMVLSITSTAFAQIDLDQDVSGEDMLEGINSKIEFVIDYVLPLFGVLFLGIAGAFLYAGHGEGTKKVWGAIGGIMLVGFGPKIVFWLIG